MDPLNIRKMPALVIGLLLVLASRFLPGFAGLSPDAMQVLGIFLGTVLLWLFADILWPSVLALLALSLLPGVGTSAVIVSSFGNVTIWFLVFSFLMTYTLSETGFLKRIALLFLNSSFARKGSWHFIFMFLLAVLALGSFIAPTVTFLLFFALHKEVTEALRLRPGSAMGSVLMIGTACVTSISCAMTPIAHTFPMMAIGFYQEATGDTISYLSYLKIGLPVGIFSFLIICSLLYIGQGKKVQQESIAFASLQLPHPGKVKCEEAFSAAVFFIVVFVWLLSGILPKQMQTIVNLGTVWPAMAGVLLLALVPISGKPVLQMNKGFQHGVSWSSILLCAAALALGKYISLEGYGITAVVGQVMQPIMGKLGTAGVLFSIIAATVIMTNFMSNIVTTTVMYNVSAAILPTLTMSSATDLVSMKTAAILVGMCASLAFATPPAIAHIALATGSDWTKPGEMLKYGGLLAIITIPVVLLFTVI